MRERTKLDQQLSAVRTIERDLADNLALIELGESEGEASIVTEAEQKLQAVKELAAKKELESLLSGEADANDCFLEVNAGAGGTEAQDWAEMLLRMYTRWAEQHGYKVLLLDESPGDEAGIKSSTIQVCGDNAYGWLKTESGVHRLVRISPFDSQARRHTSFSAVTVWPVVDENIEVEINDKDLRVDTYRASGAGGQHVNKTDSAVRVTHLPSGIVVISQLKSQHQNRAQAMTLLRAKLYEAERERQDSARAAERKGQVGSGDRSERIRTYNFPQGRVTDHRINLTLYNLAEVIEGALDPVLDALAAEEQARRLAALEAE